MNGRTPAAGGPLAAGAGLTGITATAEATNVSGAGSPAIEPRHADAASPNHPRQSSATKSTFMG